MATHEYLVEMDLTQPWARVARASKGGTPYWRYGKESTARSLIGLRELRRDAVLHHIVWVQLDDTVWGPVVEIIRLASREEIAAALRPIARLSTAIRAINAQRERRQRTTPKGGDHGSGR